MTTRSKLTLALLAGMTWAMSTRAVNPPDLPAGYNLETITIPDRITLGVGGLTFNAKGELMICTREGEVWRYRPGTREWFKFADGLHEALGIYVDPKNGDVYVMQRPEFTRLVDEDGDGVADLYQTVNAAWGLSDNYHEYSFGPVRDSKGNFYGTLNTTLSWPGWVNNSTRWDIGRVLDSKMGRAARYRGWAFQITPAGEFVPFASGMRSPSGLAISKDDELFYADNQGDWNGSSSLHQLIKGRFYGHPSSLMDHPDFAGTNLDAIPISEYEKMRSRPAVWFIHGDLANSPGEPVFDYTGGKFGPFGGQIFIGDQTRANLMRVFLEKVDGEYQGAVFDFADPMLCGVIRGVFATDGSLWVGETGRGWRSVGGRAFGLERITYDGKTAPAEMLSIRATPGGFRINFTQPMKRDEALNPANYQIRYWHYLYHPEYGSPKADASRAEVTNIQVSPDGREVTFDTLMKAGEIYQITAGGLVTERGAKLSNNTAWYTLNRIPR